MSNATTALQMVAADKSCSVNLHTLRALARRNLITLRVVTHRLTHRGPTVREIDVTANLTDAGRAMLNQTIAS